MTASVSARPKRVVFYQKSLVIYRAIQWFFAFIMNLLYRYQVSGAANFPAQGPTIIAVNHLHLLDPLAVAPVVRRQIVTLAAEKWQDNAFIGTLLRLAGVIFVQRGEVDRIALKACQDVLNAGGVLAIAPEGTRSRTGGMQRAKAGIAYLAVRTNATIVPITFWGVERLRDWLRFKHPSLQVVVGKPFRLPDLGRKPSVDELQEMADLIMMRIGLLLPAQYRGIYAERIAAVEEGRSDELARLVDL